ncbi:hypothetical protein MCEMAEM4_02518 [Burkholderiaceae bacterium]
MLDTERFFVFHTSAMTVKLLEALTYSPNVLPAINVAAQISLAMRPTQSLYQIGYLKGWAEISCANAGITYNKKSLILPTAMF